MAVDSILGKDGEFSAAAQNATSRTAADKDMFLKLLVAQLTYQDPMNPVEDKEFVAQLAQFTSVEELQNVNSNLELMQKTTERSELASAVGLVGKRALASGSQVVKATDEDTGNPATTPVIFTTDQELQTCAVTIVDGSGNIIYGASLGSRTVGEHTFEWNGKDLSGLAARDGIYQVNITATNSEGKSVLVKTEIFGTVLGVERSDGVLNLRLADGRSIPFADVQLVGTGMSQ